jgi:hypothetical protein
MQKRRKYRTVVLASLLGGAVPASSGCHPSSACHAPGSTLGQIVKMDESTAYHERAAASNGAGAPYVACRAEATIPAAVLTPNTGATDFLDSRPPSQRDNSAEGGDPRIPTGKNYLRVDSGGRGWVQQSDVSLTQGQYRVLGVGRGVDAVDCRSAAVQACNEAVDAYAQHEHQVRPSGVACQAMGGEEYCAR